MEAEVHQNRPLLDEPKVEALLLELPLLSFTEVLGPDCVILKINIGYKQIIEIWVVPLLISLGKVILSLS